VIDENMFDTEDFDDGMPWGSDDPKAALPEVDVETDEEQPAEEPDEETAPEEESTERPRNEKGQFVAQETEEESPQVDEETLEAAKERHGEDPEKLLKIIADMTQHTRNQQSQLDQLMHMQQQQMQQAQEPQYDYDEIADSDPRSATMLAWQAGNEPAFNQSWHAWAEEDPANAAAWLSSQQIEGLRQEMQAQTQPLYQQQVASQRNSVMAEFGREHPDLGDHIPTINKVLDENPLLAISAKNEASPHIQVQALQAAYEVAKARDAATLRTASQEVGQAQAAATEAALTDAFVASASNSVVQATEPSVADSLTEDWGVSGLYWDPKK
jgi:hypothetical protein